MRDGAIAAAICFAAAGSVQADTVHDEITFSVADLHRGDGTPSGPLPFLPITGHLIFDFDNGAEIPNSTPMPLADVSFPYVGSLGFIYMRWQDSVVVATRPENGGCWIGPGDFCAFIAHVSLDAPSWSGIVYVGVAENPYWTTFYESDWIQFKNAGVAPAPAPEPASWALMLAGFGAVGAALRSKRYKTSLRFS